MQEEFPRQRCRGFSSFVAVCDTVRANESRVDFAARLGVTPPQVSKLLSGKINFELKTLVSMLPNIVARVKIKVINITLLQNARNFYLLYPQLAEVVKPIYPMLSDKLGNIPLPIHLPILDFRQICPTPSDKFTTPPTTLISNLSFSLESCYVHEKVLKW